MFYAFRFNAALRQAGVLEQVPPHLRKLPPADRTSSERTPQEAALLLMAKLAPETTLHFDQAVIQQWVKKRKVRLDNAAVWAALNALDVPF